VEMASETSGRLLQGCNSKGRLFPGASTFEGTHLIVPFVQKVPPHIVG